VAGRALVWLGLILIGLLAAAPPAGADPPGPTNDVSRVTEVVPAGPGLVVDVVGGDAFLRVRVDRGHDVLVRGYQDEPYLRFDPDGRVFENRRSPAAVLNDDRFGTDADTAGTDPDAGPDWRAVGGDGTHVWHDHRIHWMAPTAPPSLGGADTGKISDWTVILELDGAPVEVRGELVRRAPPSPVPWVAVAGAVGLVVFAVAWRFPTTAAAAVLTVAGLLATAATLAEQLEVPAAAGRRYAHVAVAAMATACAAAALVGRRGRYAGALTLSAGLVLALWIILRWGVLTHAVLPSPSGAGVQRAAVAVALGAVVGAAASAARSLRRPLGRPTGEPAAPPEPGPA
jgi:hypothetical protein